MNTIAIVVIVLCVLVILIVWLALENNPCNICETIEDDEECWFCGSKK